MALFWLEQLTRLRPSRSVSSRAMPLRMGGSICLIANSLGNSVSLFVNTGGASFRAPRTYATGIGPAIVGFRLTLIMTANPMRRW